MQPVGNAMVDHHEIRVTVDHILDKRAKEPGCRDQSRRRREELQRKELLR
jgi:hypothetical protein